MTGRVGAARTIAIAVVVLAAAFAATDLAMRRADGPVGPFRGGPLREGTPASGAPATAAVAPLDTVELEVSGRSLLTGVVVLGETIYIPTTLAPLKRWDERIASTPRARLRVERQVFHGELRAVEDESLRRQLFLAAQEKYGRAGFFRDSVEAITEFFRWDPPPVP
jgi:hypothetical protein